MVCTGTTRSHDEAARSRVPAPGLVLLSVVGIQAGHACGKMLFDVAGPAGVVAMRVGFTALVLLAVCRPRLPRDGRTAALVVGFGLALAGVNTIYLAMATLPIGAAVTIQFLGPLTLALAGSRRIADLVWALLAGTGVYLFFGTGPDDLSVGGVLLALVSGACWAAYIVLNKRAGARAADGSLLALATAVAALLVVPVGLVDAGPVLFQPGVLAAGLGVALLSAIVPYLLDLRALRRMSARAFGVLMSLEPVLGGLAGLALLDEQLRATQWLAIACVSIASVGVVTRKDQRPSPPVVTRKCARR